MMYFKVTTITPCHNGIKYLMNCWESLKKQTIGIEHMQCIFVDDCSTDDTWDMLLEFEKEYPDNVCVIQLPENRRQGGARNEALKYVEGEFVQFLDQDDWLEEDALEQLYRLAKDEQADMIQFDYVHPNGKREDDTFCRENEIFELKDPDVRKEMLVSGHVVCSHHNIFYRRELLKKTNSRFPEHMVYEEPLFVYPMFFTAEKVMIVTKQLYHMRHHEESSTETLLATCLEDHPKVQKMLLDFLEEMPGVFPEYEKEIEFYFVWSYYVETVINAGYGGTLSLEMLQEMQKTVAQRYPNCLENRYLRSMGNDILDIVETVFETVTSKDGMDDLLRRIIGLYTAG